MVDTCERGKIRNKPRRQQIIDFSGLKYKNITPTDIEGEGTFFQLKGFFEIQKKVFVFIEIKLEGTELLTGQTLAYVRLVDSLKPPAICIIAEHNIVDTEKEIPAHECIVKQYKTNNKEWVLLKEFLTLKELIDKFLSHHGLDNYL